MLWETRHDYFTTQNVQNKERNHTYNFAAALFAGLAARRVA